MTDDRGRDPGRDAGRAARLPGLLRRAAASGRRTRRRLRRDRDAPGCRRASSTPSTSAERDRLLPVQPDRQHRPDPGRAPGSGRRSNGSAAPIVAVSPIVGGKALKGPADRMLATLGHEVSAVGVAAHLRRADRRHRDRRGQDRDLAPGIEALGVARAW